MAKEVYERTITFNEKLTLLGNTTPEMLTDELGLAHELKKEGERQENFYKEALKGRMGDEEEFTGDKFECTITDSERTAISGPLVEADIGVDECSAREYYVTSKFKTIKTKRKANV